MWGLWEEWQVRQVKQAVRLGMGRGGGGSWETHVGYRDIDGLLNQQRRISHLAV